MPDWSMDDLFAADAEMSEEGVPFHARSSQFQLGRRMCDGRFVNSRTETDRMREAYERLFPEYSKTWVGSGNGFINSLDRVRKITLPVVFGTCTLSPHDLCGFPSEEELWTFCRNREDIYHHTVSQSFMIFDINNLSIDDGDFSRARTLWIKSKSYLNSISDNLQNSYFVGFSNSETWLLFEFAAKALLSYRGLSDEDLKKINHFKERLLKALKEVLEEEVLKEIEDILEVLPEYNPSRYDPVEMSRIDVIIQASAAQYGAALCSISFKDQPRVMDLL